MSKSTRLSALNCFFIVALTLTFFLLFLEKSKLDSTKEAVILLESDIVFLMEHTANSLERIKALIETTDKMVDVLEEHHEILVDVQTYIVIDYYKNPNSL